MSEIRIEYQRLFIDRAQYVIDPSIITTTQKQIICWHNKINYLALSTYFNRSGSIIKTNVGIIYNERV